MSDSQPIVALALSALLLGACGPRSDALPENQQDSVQAPFVFRGIRLNDSVSSFRECQGWPLGVPNLCARFDSSRAPYAQIDMDFIGDRLDRYVVHFESKDFDFVRQSIEADNGAPATIRREEVLWVRRGQAGRFVVHARLYGGYARRVALEVMPVAVVP